MKPQCARALHNRDIEPTNNASSQTQDANCVIELGPENGTCNCSVLKENRADQ